MSEYSYIALYDDIQITDLEPSTPDNTVVYAIQVRGVDQYGNKGPWSRQLRYEAPQLLPSLESDNYQDGVTGWKMDGDGLVLYEDAKVQGDLESFNYRLGEENGWRLDRNGNVELYTGVFKGSVNIGPNTTYDDGYDARKPESWIDGTLGVGVQISSADYLTSGGTTGWAIYGDGSADFYNGRFRGDLLAGTIQIGGSSRFRVDSDGNMWIGASSFSSAPFKVSNTGALTATSASISGNIDAASITTGTLNGSRIPDLAASKITSGTFSTNRIPNLSADKITTGTLNAANVSIINLNASNITSGSLSGLSVSALSLSASGELNIQSGRLYVPIGGSVTSNTNILASGYMNSSSFRLGLGGNDPQYTKNSSDPHIVNATGSTLRVSKIIELASSSFHDLAWSENTGRIYRKSSTRRTKKNIEYIEKIPNLLEAKNVTFQARLPWEIEEESYEYDENFNEPGIEKTQFGLIAEDLHDLGLGIFVEYDIKERPAGISYDKLGAALIPYVKELYDKLESIELRLGELENAG